MGRGSGHGKGVVCGVANFSSISGFLAGQNRTVEKLWLQFFSDPSEWWDHRFDKVNARYPDFTRKKKQDALWLLDKWSPPWVEVRLAAMAPGTLQPSIVSWNTRLSRYNKSGQYKKAMKLFAQMQQEDIIPDSYTFVQVLNACANLRILEEGRHIHTLIIQNGLESDLFVSNGLVDMYGKCASIEHGRRVFDKMPVRNLASWNAVILGHAKCGQGQKALHLFREMQKERVEPNPVTFVALLNACASEASLDEGIFFHELIIQSGCESNTVVSNCLVDMYAKCGSITDALRVFNRMPTHDVVSWNAIIMGHSKCGQGQKALELFAKMQQEGRVDPNSGTFVSVLNACANEGALAEGFRVHKLIMQSDCESNIFVGSSLVHMYVKCGNIENAQRVFRKMPTRNVVSWNAMILGLAKCGQRQKALELTQQMKVDGIKPNRVTFVGLLNMCTSFGTLEEGRHVHEQIIQSGCESDVFVGTSLVYMYSKFGCLVDARRVFYEMSMRNVFAWNTLILGHARCGQGWAALELFGQMQREGVEPNHFTFVGLAHACATEGEAALTDGKQVHKQIVQRDYEQEVCVGNSLVHMYAKCGSIEDAWRVFNKMPFQDVACWNAMILGLGKCEQGQRALELYQQMQQEGVEPDSITFVGILNICASIGALQVGRSFHDEIIERCWDSDINLGNRLIDMYAKCGSMKDALIVFNKMPDRNVLTWNAIILGLVNCGQGQKALEFYQQMRLEGVEPNIITFVGVLNACASFVALEEGRHLHEHVIQNGCEVDPFITSSLINMYTKCGSIGDAWRVFSKVASPNVVAWNAMILGCAKCGQGQKALELYHQMQQEGMQPDQFTFVGVLNACATLMALQEGRTVHEQIIRTSFESDVFVGTSLVDMYSKCAKIDDAWKAFKKILKPSAVTWNAMLGGFAMHGYSKEALEHFEQMLQGGVQADQLTFVSLLSACSHAGLIDEGLHYFECMGPVYEVSATVEHYACIVDLLGRTGRLHEANHLIETMRCEADPRVWMALLGACKVHVNVEMAELVANCFLELDPGNPEGYVLLSNIYAAAGQWTSSAKIQQHRLEMGMNMQPGCF